jgi:hypothetical protein
MQNDRLDVILLYIHTYIHINTHTHMHARMQTSTDSILRSGSVISICKPAGLKNESSYSE